MDYHVAKSRRDRLHDLTKSFEIDENALRKWKKVSVIGQALNTHSFSCAFEMLGFQ